MSAPRCPWVGMMGRGADGPPGTTEGPSPAAAPTSGVDYFAQARKALSVRCPFDGQESASRDPTLPSVLASSLLRASKSHRKHKKSQGESAEKPSVHGKPATVWDETEDYFRQLTLADIDMLEPKLFLGPGSSDSCLVMPVIGNRAHDCSKNIKIDAAAVEFASISLPMKEDVLSEPQTKEAVSEKVQAAEEEEFPLEICHDALQIQGEDDVSFSLHGLLGSRERLVLTSERPNNKRKLFGGDAGLKRLLLLPHPQSGVDLCDFCCSLESTMESNKLLRCHSCNALVHQKCYGVHGVLEGTWLCSWCKHLGSAKEVSKDDGLSSRPCLFCPKEGGALKTVRRDNSSDLSDESTKFVHLFCSLWTPQVYTEDTKVMELIMDIGGAKDKRGRLVCNLCKVKHGVCIRCSHGACRTSFHPICARESKHQMEIWGKSGCSNVELRAFCSKHSNFQEMSSVAGSKNLMLAIDGHSLGAKFSSYKKLPKIRFTRKNTEKSVMQNEEKTDQMEPDEQNPVISRLVSGGGQAGPIAETGTNGETKRSTHDVAPILRKLIDQGRINADDVASEMGISLDSLQAALVGETTSFSPGLRLKIIKWLQNSVHISGLKSSGIRSSLVVSSDSKVTKIDCSDAAKRKDPENNHGEHKLIISEAVSDFTVSDAVDVKPLPKQRATRSDIIISSNDDTSCSSGIASVSKNCEGVANRDDVKGSVNETTTKSLASEQKLQEMITFGTRGATLSVDSNHVHKGSSLRVCTNNLACPDYKSYDIEGEISSVHSDFNEADDANTTIPIVTESGCLDQTLDEADVLLSTKSYRQFENGALGSVYNIHPLINHKFLEKWNSLVSKKIPKDSLGAKLEQLSEVKNNDIFEVAPEDEVEGEIVYFQSKLLDKAIAIKHCCDDLLLKIVQKLPDELSASNRHKWDLILVNQFLHEVREARKQGRKERKHKEAQAVLAAVAAAAASRNSSLRKDSTDDIILAIEENPEKPNAATVRATLHSPSLPRAKEALRSSSVKLSSDKQSMAFQMPDFLKDNALSCEICMRTETILNRIFVCSSCKVAVHLDCYRKHRNPVGSWKCELCEDMSQPPTSPKSQTDGNGRYAEVQCGLCGGLNGALRKSADGQWVHAFCAEWLLESTFRRGQEKVEGMDTLSKGKDTCCICRLDFGACLKCSYGHCTNFFHPYCANRAGFYMNTKLTGSSIRHEAYCVKHSIEQREADNRQCGAEDLKTLKQTRVELEKIRLLCERIIKREKLKKDLVLCSHDILASRRDCAVYSMLVSSSNQGASSESATTSINNRSYSGTVQRSDEITVDSTVSGKRRIRFSFKNREFDRNTGDSSTSKSSFKRKLASRESFAGKQLPHRSASVVDEEKNAKAKKTESFQKELVMTSDQASVQNQRLPKGFFYVPAVSLSKDKSLTQDSEPRDPREPGGKV